MNEIEEIKKQINELAGRIKSIEKNGKVRLSKPNCEEIKAMFNERIPDEFFLSVNDIVRGTDELFFRFISTPEITIKKVKSDQKGNKGKSNVDHPSHYQSKNGVECIDAMASESLFLHDMRCTPLMSFCYLNAFKYIFRKDKKGRESEDIKKAIWYVNKFNELAKSAGIECVTYSMIETRVNLYKGCE